VNSETNPLFNWPFWIEKITSFLAYDQEDPFIFTSLNFWIFFFLFLIFFSVSYQNKKAKNLIILGFSLFFYYKSSGWAVLLLLFTITQDYFIAKGIGEKKASSFQKKFLLFLSVTTNLLVLGYFKYAFLIIDFLNSAFSIRTQKQNWLAHFLPDNDLLKLDPDHILLPVGISFFIFHTLSYTIDVYRGIVKPLGRWLDFAVFVSFFPELVAGPIVRARDFVDQISSDYKVTSTMFGKGICLILGGLFKKIVISDGLSSGMVDRVFDSPELASPMEAWLGTYGYALQIFCDFSGYTDIAIGLALILGYHLKPNFDQPYKSLTITEFWRRWHISLSVWLRDYLYIPLGGNRKGNFRTYVHLLITMLLGGLWHGASVKFLLWGALHGVALAIHKFWMEMIGQKSKWFPSWISWILTFHFVAFCWIPFRAENGEMALHIFQKLWMPWDFSLLRELVYQYYKVLGLLVLGFLLHFIPTNWKNRYYDGFERTPAWALSIVVMATVLLIYQFKTSDSQPFIYFQF